LITISSAEATTALRTRNCALPLPRGSISGFAFQFEATRVERYIVACYEAEHRGHFNPHRDNTTKGTAHRKFAVTINLNSEEYEGGNLRFPEFGDRTYRASTGGAIVFSCGLLHEATPVTSGRRYAFLPFLYDDAAAALREQNNAFLGDGVGAYSSS
jgi:predicted 2-oxoglutarate/Fe(II)-dependent dioxygenase YbiX